MLMMPTKRSEAWPQTIAFREMPAALLMAMKYPEDGYSLGICQSPGMGREPAKDR